MKTKKSSPEQSAINLDIEQIENDFFGEEKIPEVKRHNAFQYLCLSILCDLDLNEIEDEDSIDGNDEEGIDTINFNKLKDNIIISIFNCKSSERNNYSASDLTKLGRGLEYIFEEKQKIYKKLKNNKLVKKIEDIRNEKEKVVRVDVYYCVFGGSSFPKNVKRKKDEIQDRYNMFLKSQYPNAKFSFMLVNNNNLFSIKTKRSESLRGVSIEIPYYDKDKRMRPEVETGKDVTGYLTTVRAKEIAKLVEEYGDKLFEKNVRGWLKFKQSNKDIYDSCTTKNSSMFWFMNNGITIIGDTVNVNDDTARFKIKNLQIVNGQQTARMIHEAYKDNKLKSSTKVMCRIFQASVPDFINKIAKSTNSQLSIGSRDLMSNDLMQLAVGETFEKLGFFYERQRGQEKPKKRFKKTISSKKLAQVSLAILCKKPSLARKNIEDNFFNKNKYYEYIFNRDPKELLLAYFIFEHCDREAKANKENELKYFGALHIARIIWEYKREPFLKDIELTIKNFEVGKIDLKKSYQKALKVLDTILDKKKKEEDIVSLGHYLSRVEVDELLFHELST